MGILDFLRPPSVASASPANAATLDEGPLPIAVSEAAEEGAYDGGVVFSSEGPGGVPRHYACLEDGSPDFDYPLIWIDPDPESPDRTPGSHYRRMVDGDASHLDRYHRRDVVAELP